MATQTVNFPFIAGQSGLSMRLRSLVSGLTVDTQSASETAVDNGIQTAVFTDITAGRYLIQIIDGADVLADDTITLTLTTGTFWVDSVSDVCGDALETTSQYILGIVQSLGASALSAATWTSGAISGFPTSLIIGDSYLDDVNRQINIYYRDADGVPITAIGTKNFTDNDFVASLRISQDNRSSVVVAACSWVAAVGPTEGYLKVELSRDQTRRAAEGVAEMQLVFRWDGDVEVLIASQTVTWVRKI